MRPYASRILLCAAGLAALLATGVRAQTVRQYVFEPRADGQAYRLVLKEVPRPTAGPHEVLVRMRAAALNGADDLRMLDAKPGIRPLVARVFDFEQAPEAFEFARGEPMGKVVIRF